MRNLENREQKIESEDLNPFSILHSPARRSRGYTLVELIVSVGLFAMVMTLASGAYLLMISLNRQTQSIATGINNLSFAFETMTRNIRTGTNYACPGGTSSCTIDAKANAFSFVNENGVAVAYSLANSAIQRTTNGITTNALTDSLSVTISSLMFYVSGATPGDAYQPHVTIIVSGTVSSGPGKTQAFSIETGATMRGTDL